MYDEKSRLLVAKAMNSVKEDMRTNNEVIGFTLHMIIVMVKFLRMSIGDAAVSGLLHEELEELKTPLTPEDYPPGHPKADNANR